MQIYVRADAVLEFSTMGLKVIPEIAFSAFDCNNNDKGRKLQAYTGSLETFIPGVERET